jgi:hypothetical protein
LRHFTNPGNGVAAVLPVPQKKRGANHSINLAQPLAKGNLQPFRKPVIFLAVEFGENHQKAAKSHFASPAALS